MLLGDSLCSRTRLLSNASEDLALLGEGTAPDPSFQPQEVLVEEVDDNADHQMDDNGGCSISPRRFTPRDALAHIGLTGAPSAPGGALLGVLVLLQRRFARLDSR